MKEWAPLEAEAYKDLYRSAQSGNYDIYVVFVERGLGFLNRKGHLGFILPNKFFTAKYGENLRALIAEHGHLEHVVHFGDQQVFTGATTYTALLFLSKVLSESVLWAEADDLSAWRIAGRATTGEVPTEKITRAEWHFSVGTGASIFERLSEMPVKLGDVAERIFQGLVTGADGVFVVHNTGKQRFFSDATKQEHRIEPELMHPLCKGSVDLRRYHVTPLVKSILFPYKLTEEGAKLISPHEFQGSHPLAWEYLNINRQLLESRERGKWKHDRWYAFGRSQNLGEMEQRKILTPSIAIRSSFTLDVDDYFYFLGSGGGGGGGYGITLRSDCRLSYEFVLGLLNSRLLDTYLKATSSPFRGGYFAYNRQYIERLPIRIIDFSQAADRARHDKMVSLVERMLELHRRRQAAESEGERELLQRQIDSTDREIDALVYELYGLSDEEVRMVEGK